MLSQQAPAICKHKISRPSCGHRARDVGLVRNALLDPDDTAQPPHREEIEGAYDSTDDQRTAAAIGYAVLDTFDDHRVGQVHEGGASYFLRASSLTVFTMQRGFEDQPP